MGVARTVRSLPLCLASLAALNPIGVHAQQPQVSFCGPIENAFGPFDYRTATTFNRQLVESAHFTAEVEALIRGVTTRRPGGDIGYTLRVFPNHPRALLATIRLAEIEKTDKPVGMTYTVDCWLERAVRFQPRDPVVRMIRSGFFAKVGRRDAALADLQAAERFAEPDNAFTQYNIGLSYLTLGEYERALEFAHKAMALGMPRTELRDRLKQAGRWTDPPAEAASAPASAMLPATPRP
jgi:tetratricopeptide (TPR) repeat protein